MNRRNFLIQGIVRFDFADRTCSRDQGISSQVADNSYLFEPNIRRYGRKRRTSLYFTLLPGNRRAETGSLETLSSSGESTNHRFLGGGAAFAVCHEPAPLYARAALTMRRSRVGKRRHERWAAVWSRQNGSNATARTNGRSALTALCRGRV